MPSERAIKAARQHAETSRLLGVDFLPRSTRAVSVLPRKTEAVAEATVPSSDKAGALSALRARYEQQSEVAKSMPGWTNIVFGDGSPDARLMFVGEAPGADEDEQGIPFVGRAGKKLNEMIAAMGLTRPEVYIANVLKVRPPNNRTPTPEEAALDGPFLAEQIEIIQPEVLCTLGRPAANFLLDNREAMGSLRGRWFEYRGIPLMPTFHPAYLLRSYTPEVRGKVWSDLQKIMERLGLSPS
ncbi:MAG: uracil-DNA glycosylase [Phycisphaeraceae bacterium]|nr:uracil-DNA glycosylase [Phycisphaerales bacterium]MCB9842680.1 uracil-DNA glycosylase [Phycisphaeraceae bacterium]